MDRIVDGVLIKGEIELVDSMLKAFDKQFKPTAVVHGLETLRLFGVNIIQHNDFSRTTDKNGKLFALELVPLTGLRRNVMKDELYKIQNKRFSSTNS